MPYDYYIHVHMKYMYIHIPYYPVFKPMGVKADF